MSRDELIALEQCKAPGCENLTDRDICDNCDAWVSEQAQKMHDERAASLRAKAGDTQDV